MADRRCYFAREIADMLGMSVDHFYRVRARLEAQGLPPSLPGRVRIERTGFDAWLAGRRGPRLAPANDADLGELEAARARCAAAYRLAANTPR